jgi:hypothetical protein
MALQIAPDNCPLTERHVTLVRIRKEDVDFWTAKHEKRDALLRRKPGDIWIAAWGGEWSTSLFSLTEDQLTKLCGDLF